MPSLCFSSICCHAGSLLNSARDLPVRRLNSSSDKSSADCVRARAGEVVVVVVVVVVEDDAAAARRGGSAGAAELATAVDMVEVDGEGLGVNEEVRMGDPGNGVLACVWSGDAPPRAVVVGGDDDDDDDGSSNRLSDLAEPWRCRRSDWSVSSGALVGPDDGEVDESLAAPAPMPLPTAPDDAVASLVLKLLRASATADDDEDGPAGDAALPPPHNPDTALLLPALLDDDVSNLPGSPNLPASANAARRSASVGPPSADGRRTNVAPLDRREPVDAANKLELDALGVAAAVFDSRKSEDDDESMPDELLLLALPAPPLPNSDAGRAGGGERLPPGVALDDDAAGEGFFAEVVVVAAAVAAVGDARCAAADDEDDVPDHCGIDTFPVGFSHVVWSVRRCQ